MSKPSRGVSSKAGQGAALLKHWLSRGRRSRLPDPPPPPGGGFVGFRPVGALDGRPAPARAPAPRRAPGSPGRPARLHSPPARSRQGGEGRAATGRPRRRGAGLPRSRQTPAVCQPTGKGARMAGPGAAPCATARLAQGRRHSPPRPRTSRFQAGAASRPCASTLKTSMRSGVSRGAHRPSGGYRPHPPTAARGESAPRRGLAGEASRGTRRRAPATARPGPLCVRSRPPLVRVAPGPPGAPFAPSAPRAGRREARASPRLLYPPLRPERAAFKASSRPSASSSERSPGQP